MARASAGATLCTMADGMLMLLALALVSRSGAVVIPVQPDPQLSSAGPLAADITSVSQASQAEALQAQCAATCSMCNASSKVINGGCHCYSDNGGEVMCLSLRHQTGRGLSPGTEGSAEGEERGARCIGMLGSTRGALQGLLGDRTRNMTAAERLQEFRTRVDALRSLAVPFGQRQPPAEPLLPAVPTLPGVPYPSPSQPAENIAGTHTFFTPKQAVPAAKTNLPVSPFPSKQVSAALGIPAGIIKDTGKGIARLSDGILGVTRGGIKDATHESETLLGSVRKHEESGKEVNVVEGLLGTVNPAPVEKEAVVEEAASGKLETNQKDKDEVNPTSPPETLIPRIPGIPYSLRIPGLIRPQQGNPQGLLGIPNLALDQDVLQRRVPAAKRSVFSGISPPAYLRNVAMSKYPMMFLRPHNQQVSNADDFVVPRHSYEPLRVVRSCRPYNNGAPEDSAIDDAASYERAPISSDVVSDGDIQESDTSRNEKSNWDTTTINPLTLAHSIYKVANGDLSSLGTIIHSTGLVKRKSVLVGS